ncbi:flagellar biosynthesis anti-sigma factor FlgM [Paenibacillus sp. GCM10012307]|uniref:Negative regulator of flagellin synthesis n=1 Tax=Paenibacillus roseus TaxID=2798579 RepID=A0A934J7R3_9BACL|nr:flagellar biosynthesis anti-sigma factor FlgM [Paenibacillus roseus]MBJ6361925.1 flagellar biosynthesis anti-sigma factor FlgM [Paenibacillus roseus]
MKLNEIGRIAGIQKYAAGGRDKQSDHASSIRRKDEVSISPEAKELLESQRTNQAERANKLNELKQSVSTGTYHVEAGKIADKLLPYLKFPKE